MKLGIVIPTLNESQQIQTLIPKIGKKYKNTIVFVIDDLSIDETAQIAKELGAIVPFHKKKLGYGKSLVEGLCLAWYTFNCDYVMEMDADHPLNEVKKFLDMEKPRRFVVVGKEKDKWKLARKVANGLTRYLLGIKDVSHPTCGFVLWSKDILKHIPWKRVKSNGDAIHVELLFWAKRIGANISEVEFSGHAGERRYGLFRVLGWLRSFMRLLRLKYLWWWRNF